MKNLKTIMALFSASLLIASCGKEQAAQAPATPSTTKIDGEVYVMTSQWDSPIAPPPNSPRSIPYGEVIWKFIDSTQTLLVGADPAQNTALASGTYNYSIDSANLITIDGVLFGEYIKDSTFLRIDNSIVDGPVLDFNYDIVVTIDR